MKNDLVRLSVPPRRCNLESTGRENVRQSQETLDVIAADIVAPKEHSLHLFLGTVEQAGEEVQVLDVKELFPSVIHGRARRRRHS